MKVRDNMDNEQNNNQHSDQQNNEDENIAVQFPDWDLLPPDVLLKRGNNENA